MTDALETATTCGLSLRPLRQGEPSLDAGPGRPLSFEVADNSVRAGASRHRVGCKGLPKERPSDRFAQAPARGQGQRALVGAWQTKVMGPFGLVHYASRLGWEGHSQAPIVS